MSASWKPGLSGFGKKTIYFHTARVSSSGHGNYPASGGRPAWGTKGWAVPGIQEIQRTLHALDENAMNFVYSKLIIQVRFGKKCFFL